jgi:diguanylate cyclase (GGDEF)-like protein
MVICATGLPDGSGLDALAYVRGIRPGLPVVLTGPPNDAELAVEAIRAGAIDFLITTGLDLRTLPLAVEKCLAHQRIKQENERLQQDLSRSLAELAMKNQQLHAVINQLESMARTDDLTGLANRRWLNLMLEGNWAEATRNNLPLACLMIDLDGFKRVNDQFGHHCGDEMLRLAGKVIQACCRSVDTMARYGGDEFCVLLPHAEATEALQVAERILQEFGHTMSRLPFEMPRLSMSIGVSHIDLSRPINSDQLVMHADEAMYSAKLAGKHGAMIYRGDGRSTLTLDEPATAREEDQAA